MLTTLFSKQPPEMIAKTASRGRRRTSRDNFTRHKSAIRAIGFCCALIAANAGVRGSGITEDFEAEGALSSWSIKTENGSLDVAGGYDSPRGAQVSGKQVELTRYEKDGIWTNLDASGDFEVSFLIQKGVSWRLVLAGQDGHGFVVYISSTKIEVSSGGETWWEAKMQSFPIPDIAEKWMTLRLSPLQFQGAPGERLQTKMALFETGSPGNKYVEDLAVGAAGPETGAPFRRVAEIKIFEWSSGSEEEFLKIDNIRFGESQEN